MAKRPLVGVTILAIAACSDARAPNGPETGVPTPNLPASTPGEDLGARTPLRLVPDNATLVIDTATAPPTPASLAYRVLRDGPDGEADVTAIAVFEVDAAVGSFTGATFTTASALPDARAGTTAKVRARTPDGVALGALTVAALRKTGASRDFYFVVPFGGAPSPAKDELAFATHIEHVDVVFAMDTTGSMAGSIANLKAALGGSLLGQLQAAIPDVGLSIVDYKDYPFAEYGDGPDFPVKVRQPVTTNLGFAQVAVDQYVAGGGFDTPEAQIPAMWHVLTGEALAWPGGSVPAHAPKTTGTWGGVDFRAGSVPVVVNVTDSSWHSEVEMPYGFPAPSMGMLKGAFVDKNAFFVNLTSGDEAQANELSDATGSYVPPSAFGPTCAPDHCCTGVSGQARVPTGPAGNCRLNFKHDGGSGVSSGIVTAVSAISEGAAYDVKAVATSDPGNAEGVDATAFIQAIRAMDEGSPASGCLPRAARDLDGDGIKETFVDVKVKTPICFEVLPRSNTTVPPADAARFYQAHIRLVGLQGNVPLDDRTVLFLVPPATPQVN